MSVQAQFCQPGSLLQTSEKCWFVRFLDFRSRDLGCSHYYHTQQDLAFHVGDAAGTVTSYPRLPPGLYPGRDSLSQERILGTKPGDRLELCALPLPSLDENELLKENRIK